MRVLLVLAASWSAGSASRSCAGSGPLPEPKRCIAASGPRVDLTTEQAENAALIAAIAEQRGLPARAPRSPSRRRTRSPSSTTSTTATATRSGFPAATRHRAGARRADHGPVLRDERSTTRSRRSTATSDADHRGGPAGAALGFPEAYAPSTNQTRERSRLRCAATVHSCVFTCQINPLGSGSTTVVGLDDIREGFRQKIESLAGSATMRDSPSPAKPADVKARGRPSRTTSRSPMHQTSRHHHGVVPSTAMDGSGRLRSRLDRDRPSPHGDTLVRVSTPPPPTNCYALAVRLPLTNECVADRFSKRNVRTLLLVGQALHRCGGAFVGDGERDPDVPGTGRP